MEFGVYCFCIFSSWKVGCNVVVIHTFSVCFSFYLQHLQNPICSEKARWRFLEVLRKWSTYIIRYSHLLALFLPLQFLWRERTHQKCNLFWVGLPWKGNFFREKKKCLYRYCPFFRAVYRSQFRLVLEQNPLNSGSEMKFDPFLKR